MRRSYRILPIYTGDVSGVASALYELGGMVVMHDPSGCNSTYNTHDEIRWYNRESSIFLSGLTETDAILGNDEKLIRDVCETAGKLHPFFIALAGSPIPFLNGTDMPAIARIIEKKMEIPTFSVPTNGMHDYIYGAGLAMKGIAEHFVEEPVSAPELHTVNLLGITPLDFGPMKQVNNLKENLMRYGWKVKSCWAMGDSLENIKKAAEAEVNLVVSSVGLKTAEFLEEKFHMPWVAGVPIDDYAEQIAKALEKKERFPYIYDRKTEKKETQTKKVMLIGEPVTMETLAAAVERLCQAETCVVCPMELTEGLLAEKDCAVKGEEETEAALKDADIVIADPLYRPVVPKKCAFYELSHVAFSGRIFLKQLGDPADLIRRIAAGEQ